MLFACNQTNNTETTKQDYQNNSQIIEENEQGLAFYLQDDDTYAVGSGTAVNLSTIIVPSTYKGKPVTKVQRYGFSGHQYNVEGIVFGFKKVVLPESIVSIDDYAFSDSSLEEIVVPKSVKRVGEYAFSFSYTSNFRRIQFNGTFDEFKRIEFADNWISSTEENEIKFAFDDQVVQFDSLFEKISVKKPIFEDYSYDYIVSGDYINEECVTSIYDEEKPFLFSKESIECFHLRRTFLTPTIISDNPNVATVSYDEGVKTSNFWVSTLSVGYSNITISVGDLSKTFALRVVDSFETTVHDTLAKIKTTFDSIKQNYSNTFTFNEYYSINGFAHIFNDGRRDYIHIKDSLNGEEEISVSYASQYPTINEGDHIRIRGILRCYVENGELFPYFNMVSIDAI